MRAAVPITEDAIAPAYDEPMEAPRLHLQDEVARGAVWNVLDRGKAHASRSLGQSLAWIHAVSAPGCRSGCAAAKAGSARAFSAAAMTLGKGARSTLNRSALKTCGTRKQSATVG